MTCRLLLALLASLASPMAHAADDLAFGITSATALSLPHFIAEAKRYFAAEGLNVDTIAAGSAARVLQQLTGRSLNMAQVATDQTLRAILHGAPIRIIAGAAANAPFRVVAAKSVKSWSDLRGRSVSVGGPADVTLYFLRIMARRNGLADQDYDLLYAGGTPDRFAQLASGAVGAAVLTNPVDLVALDQGFVDLGSVPQYLPHWTQNNLLVDMRWAARHRGAVLALLRAEIKATRFFYEAANRDEVIGILAKYTRTSLPIAAKTGTAQNGVNNSGLDDAVFTCFASVDNPQIAVGVVVKGGGLGADASAPLAVKIIKAYMQYETKR